MVLRLALGAALGLACTGGSEPGLRLVLVTLDTLRYDSFGEIGAGPSAMPLLRQRAEGCQVFERSFAAVPATGPTHATILTGLHPWEHGLTANGQVLGEGLTTLAEVLRDAGFATGAVVASYPLGRRFGFAQGFDDYYDRFDEGYYDTTNWGDSEGPKDNRFFSLAESVTEAALEMVERTAGARRQFFWFHYFDPHDPYGDSAPGPTVSALQTVKRVVGGQADREQEIRRAKRLYDQDVAYLDRSLDRLLRHLDREGERFSTHLLLTSDHGESFGEDDSMFHGRRLTEGQIRVPLVLCSPTLDPGRRQDVSGSVDVAATILSLAGAPPAGTSGRDLTRSPRATGRAVGMRMSAAATARELRLDGRWYPLGEHLFYLVDAGGVIHRGDGQRLLEPLGEVGPDGGRSDDQEHLGLFEGFAEQLEQREEEPTLDPEAEQALRALGYLQ